MFIFSLCNNDICREFPYISVSLIDRKLFQKNTEKEWDCPLKKRSSLKSTSPLNLKIPMKASRIIVDFVPTAPILKVSRMQHLMINDHPKFIISMGIQIVAFL